MLDQRGFAPLLFILIVILLSGGIVLGSVYIKSNLLERNSSTPKSSAIPENIEKAPAEKQAGNLKILYSITTYDPKKATNGETKLYVSDINNQNVEIFDPNKSPLNLSPDKKYHLKVTTSPETNKIVVSTFDKPTDYKTVVDLSTRKDVLTLYHADWTKDNRIYFELRSLTPSESQFYIVNPDGSNLQMIGKISNYPGGHFMGYDSANNVVYVTQNNFETKEQEFYKYIVKDSKVQKLFVTPLIESAIVYPIILSSDYSHAYYGDGKTVTKFNLTSLEKELIFDISKIYPNASIGSFDLRLSPKDDLLVISYGDSKNRYSGIYNLSTKQLSDVLNDPKFVGYEYHPFYTISPDENYIFLSTRKKDIPENLSKATTADDFADLEKIRPGYYSGHNCVLDIKNKKIIPFFNCPLDDQSNFVEQKNQDFYFIGWYLE